MGTNEKWFYEAFYDFKDIDDDELNDEDVSYLDFILSDSSKDICLTLSVNMLPAVARKNSVYERPWTISEICFELPPFKHTKATLVKDAFSSSLSANASPFVMPSPSAQIQFTFPSV